MVRIHAHLLATSTSRLGWLTVLCAAVRHEGTTTYNARSYLQPQLNKAIRKADRATKVL